MTDIKRVRLPDGTVYEFHGSFTDAHLEDAMRQLEIGPPPEEMFPTTTATTPQPAADASLPAPPPLPKVKP